MLSLSPESNLSVPFPNPAMTILVVDDQRYARRVAYRILSEAGYRVLEAEDGEEALDAMHSARARVDMVVIDVVLPGMDGVELANEIWELWPDKPILFTSGFAAEVLAQHGLAYLDVPFLAKPYTRDEALAKVEESLKAGRRREAKTAEERQSTRRRQDT